MFQWLKDSRAMFILAVTAQVYHVAIWASASIAAAEFLLVVYAVAAIVGVSFFVAATFGEDVDG